MLIHCRRAQTLINKQLILWLYSSENPQHFGENPGSSPTREQLPNRKLLQNIKNTCEIALLKASCSLQTVL